MSSPASSNSNSPRRNRVPQSLIDLEKAEPLDAQLATAVTFAPANVRIVVSPPSTSAGSSQSGKREQSGFESTVKPSSNSSASSSLLNKNVPGPSLELYDGTTEDIELRDTPKYCSCTPENCACSRSLGICYCPLRSCRCSLPTFDTASTRISNPAAHDIPMQLDQRIVNFRTSPLSVIAQQVAQGHLNIDTWAEPCGEVPHKHPGMKYEHARESCPGPFNWRFGAGINRNSSESSVQTVTFKFAGREDTLAGLTIRRPVSNVVTRDERNVFVRWWHHPWTCSPQLFPTTIGVKIAALATLLIQVACLVLAARRELGLDVSYFGSSEPYGVLVVISYLYSFGTLLSLPIQALVYSGYMLVRKECPKRVLLGKPTLYMYLGLNILVLLLAWLGAVGSVFVVWWVGGGGV